MRVSRKKMLPYQHQTDVGSNGLNRIDLDKIEGRVYGGNGGDPFDDSTIFADHTSIASDFTPSEYHVTFCPDHGLSIEFTYATILHDGSTISIKASSHGVKRTCSSHTILLKGNAIKKVTVVTRNFTSTVGPSVTAIAGIQFFTNKWESPFYGDTVGSTATEMSDSHMLGRLQFIWIRPQTYQREYFPSPLHPIWT
jgi:hypothetical protein